jgi:hypothetical protein
VLKHGTEIRTAVWVGGVVGGAVLLTLGVVYWQFELGSYRIRIEPKKPPPITKGWEAEVQTVK